MADKIGIIYDLNTRTLLRIVIPDSTDELMRHVQVTEGMVILDKVTYDSASYDGLNTFIPPLAP